VIVFAVKTVRVVWVEILMGEIGDNRGMRRMKPDDGEEGGVILDRLIDEEGGAIHDQFGIVPSEGAVRDPFSWIRPVGSPIGAANRNPLFCLSTDWIWIPHGIEGGDF
jgi:hypothetical protein